MSSMNNPSSTSQQYVSYEFKTELERGREKVEDLFKFEDQKIGRGTYGHVYKAINRYTTSRFPEPVYALKSIDITGPSSWREIAILRELKHVNIINLHGVFVSLERKIYMLLEYADHDLWHIIKHNRQMKSKKAQISIPPGMVKSILYQLLDGIHYMHSNWILHRDLKPANILVMGEGPSHLRGRVKIADLGFARSFSAPLRPMVDLDPVVVTFWYRSPELLMGAKHYSKGIDVWAIGCIFAELMTAEPLFICKEEDLKAQSPYHYDQLEKIFSVMGYPSLEDWSDFLKMPQYETLARDLSRHGKINAFGNCNIQRYLEIEKHKGFINQIASADQQKMMIKLLKKLLAFDPRKRISCKEALEDQYFQVDPKPHADVFWRAAIPYPARELMEDIEKKILPNTTSEPLQAPSQDVSQTKKMRYPTKEDSFPAPPAPMVHNRYGFVDYDHHSGKALMASNLDMRRQVTLQHMNEMYPPPPDQMPPLQPMFMPPPSMPLCYQDPSNVYPPPISNYRY